MSQPAHSAFPDHNSSFPRQRTQLITVTSATPQCNFRYGPLVEQTTRLTARQTATHAGRSWPSIHIEQMPNRSISYVAIRRTLSTYDRKILQLCKISESAQPRHLHPSSSAAAASLLPARRQSLLFKSPFQRHPSAAAQGPLPQSSASSRHRSIDDFTLLPGQESCIGSGAHKPTEVEEGWIWAGGDFIVFEEDEDGHDAGRVGRPRR